MATPLTNEQIGTKWWRQHLTDQRLFDGNLNSILRDAAKHTGQLVESAVPDESFSHLVRRAQYADSRTAILQANEDLFGRLQTRTYEGINQASRRAGGLWEDVNKRLSGGAPTELRSSFRADAARQVELIRSRYINAIDLSESVYRNKQLANGLVDRTVNRGILANKSAAEIASDVRGLIRPDTPGGISYAAKRLGRTELNNAFHETTRRAGAAQPWVEGMLWNLSGSHPRKDVCNEYAEQDNHNMGAGVFPSRMVPGKPHPQCLCYITAITPSDDEFLSKLFDGDYDSFLESE